MIIKRLKRVTGIKTCDCESQALTPEQQQQVAVRLLQQQQLKLQQQQSQQTGQQIIANTGGPQIHQLAQTIPTMTTAGIMTSSKATATNVNPSSVATTTVVTTMVKARPGSGQVTIQDPRTTSANMVNLQQTAQRIATASLVSASQISASPTSQKGGLVGVVATSGGKTPTAAQLQYYRQQQVLRQQQQLKVLQAQAGGQKVSVTVPATAAAVVAQQRATAATLMKQGIATAGTAGTVTAQTTMGRQTVTRAVSDTEMAALIKRQTLQQQAKATTATLAQVQVIET